MYAEERLKAEIVAKALTKKGRAISAAGDSATGRGTAVCHNRPDMPGRLSSAKRAADIWASSMQGMT